MKRALVIATSLIVLGMAGGALAQEGRAEGRGRGAGPARRPGLFLKEEWGQTEKGGEHPTGPESVTSPNLELKLYGPTGKEVLLTGAKGDDNNPIHLWTGMCTTPCAIALRDKNNMADLTGLARIRWVTKMSGLHQVHPIVKLADGTWLVGDKGDGSVADWQTSEINFNELKWLRLDIEKVVTKGTFVANPDLSKVDEIGYVDLMPGSGHGAGGWSDVGAIEVYANAVKR
ncbi:MAG TPA: hypothetical protein VN628_15790 [Vicinamibacterales bacterium]|nr:hypothetical protein [Vicinamibacterales bacterium]